MSRLVRLIVGFGLTALALWLADPIAVVRAAAQADLRWILAAVLLVIPDRALMAYRWIVLLRAVGPARHVPVPAVLRVFFVSTFVGTFLPSIGGDAARAYGLSRHQVPAADSAASVVMDRLLGAWSLLLFAAAALTFSDIGRDDPGVVTAMAVTTLGCAAAAVVIYSRPAADVVRRLLLRLPVEAVRRGTARLLDAVRRYGRHHGVLVHVTLGSIAVQTLRILQAWCLGRGLGIDAPVEVYFALIPWTLLVMLVPISVNGLGTSQIAFVYLFGLAGVGGAPAFALSVLCVALGAVGNLPGGLLYAMGPGRASSVSHR